MKEEVIKKYTDCCNRMLPTTSVLLGSAIDPENIEQGIRANVYQPQVDDLISRITASINSKIQRETEKVIEKINNPDRPTLTTRVITLGEGGQDGESTTTPEGAVGISVFVRTGTVVLGTGETARTLLTGESINLGDDAYKLGSIEITANSGSSALVLITEK